MAIDRRRLEEYIYYINSLLKQEDFYDTYMKAIHGGKNQFSMTQRFQKKKFDLDWVEAIEDCVISLDNIVRNPRKFIVIEEDIVDVSLARNITTESVKHLATHTNLIAAVKDDMVIPSKILNTSKEESFEIYENRFVYTLLLKLHQFISSRFDAIRMASTTSDTFSVTINSDYAMDKNTSVRYKMETILNMPLDSVLQADTNELTDVERIARLQNVVNGFMGSPFAKTMVSCALVRPPIIRTNVILKNPDFKKALVLWQFIDSYQQTGYEIKSFNETADISATNQEKFANLIYLNNILTESIVRARTEELDISGEEEEKKKEKTKADEYITKNIDDFVPDDFPELKLSIFETRHTYTRLPEVASITPEESRKVARAIDRCLLQYKINKAKHDSEEQIKLERKLMQEEAKAKAIALRQAKANEKKAEKEKVMAEKRAAREAKEHAKLEKERLAREAIEREERIRIEEEQAMQERIAREQKEAEERIVEENARLKLMYESEKARLAAEKDKVREELEREKQLQFMQSIEGDAMLKMRRKEQQRIRQMRAAQELALRELITAHYQDLEKMQQQAILDMEQIADLCDFDIFDEEEDVDIAPTPTAADFTRVDMTGIAPEEKPVEDDIPEMDVSLTRHTEDGVNSLVAKLVKEDLEEEVEEEDPTMLRTEMTSPLTFTPNAERNALYEDDDDEDIMLTGFAAPIDATAKYSVDYGTAAADSTKGKIVRPSKVMPGAKATPKVSALSDDWDFEGTDALEDKHKTTKPALTEEQKAAVESKTIVGKTVGKGSTAEPVRTAVFMPRNSVSSTSSKLDDIIANSTMTGGVTDEDDKKKKKRFGKK